jgi:DNA-binding response OmpR family regulator
MVPITGANLWCDANNHMAKKILIVEDDKFLRELIVRKLSNEGYEVVEAVDGEQGIQKVKETKPDLVLLDLILPGIDGFEVLAQKKEDPFVATIPVIVLSNLGQKEDVDRGLGLGATDYLIKAHFTPGEIIEKVRNIIK